MAEHAEHDDLVDLVHPADLVELDEPARPSWREAAGRPAHEADGYRFGDATKTLLRKVLPPSDARGARAETGPAADGADGADADDHADGDGAAARGGGDERGHGWMQARARRTRPSDCLPSFTRPPSPPPSSSRAHGAAQEAFARCCRVYRARGYVGSVTVSGVFGIYAESISVAIGAGDVAPPTREKLIVDAALCDDAAGGAAGGGGAADSALVETGDARIARLVRARPPRARFGDGS